MFAPHVISKSVRSMRLLGAVALITFWPATVTANAIVHPAVYVLPLSFGLLIPIVFIEAHIANRIFTWGYRRSLGLSAVANFISTLIGLPVSIRSPLPFLGYYDRVWFIALLIGPMYIASVLCEFAIASLYMELYVSRRPAWRWALIANAVTYLMILAILAFWLVASYLTAPPNLQPEPQDRSMTS